MDHLGFLFAANVFVWGGILLYIFTLKKRQQALRKDLELLKASLNKDSES
ncbi:MAG: hypothetical protein COV67_01130 [Nitrospinae bacterium CG11_big_fil_rev_8_21_14_0_20_56_8]|nr:MAG: hypothetical protein COV67_01130 [Nitrospinae bacterium CG11_big_fil_rev_8_21_14_0_20_56_8]